MTFHREIDIGGMIGSSSLGAAIMPPFHVYTHVTDDTEDDMADQNVPAPGTEVQDTQQEALAPATGQVNTPTDGGLLTVEPNDPTPAPDAHDHWVKDQLTYYLASNPNYLASVAHSLASNNQILAGILLSNLQSMLSAGGSYAVFAQEVNTSYDGTKVALYEARMISGPMTHPLTGQELPRQSTVYDDILQAIHGLAR